MDPEKHFLYFGIVWAGFGLQKQIQPEGSWYILGLVWYWRCICLSWAFSLVWLGLVGIWLRWGGFLNNLVLKGQLLVVMLSFL